MNANVINRKMIIAQIITAAAAVAGAVALPQIFHAIGIISGTGAAVGAALLPMHIPVLLAGFSGGAAAGCAAGVLSPVVSFLIAGMPSAAILPFMIIELGVYGLVSGLLSRTKLNSFVKLLIVQVSGRAARALAVLASIFILGNENLTLAAAYMFVVEGLFGILIQWAVVPLAVNRMNKGLRRFYE